MKRTKHYQECGKCNGEGTLAHQLDVDVFEHDVCEHCAGDGRVEVYAVIGCDKHIITYITNRDNSWTGYSKAFEALVVAAGGDMFHELLMLPEIEPAPEITKLEGIPLVGYNFQTGDLGSFALTDVLIAWSNCFYEITGDEPEVEYVPTAERRNWKPVKLKYVPAETMPLCFRDEEYNGWMS